MLIPLAMKPKSNVLIAGVGGGFDFLYGLPIGLSLQNEGHNIIAIPENIDSFEESKAPEGALAF